MRFTTKRRYVTMKPLVGASFLLMALAPFVSYACGDAADKVHIGKVASVDEASSSFTLSDIETGKQITFKANKEILLQSATASGTVAVKYESDGENLIAQSIE